MTNTFCKKGDLNFIKQLLFSRFKVQSLLPRILHLLLLQGRSLKLRGTQLVGVVHQLKGHPVCV